MHVPMIPLTSDTDEIVLFAEIQFDGCEIKQKGTILKKQRLIPSVPYGSPILVMDVKGLQNDIINPTILKRSKMRGVTTWLMTCVRNTDDLFDAFNSDADKILMPYHKVESEDNLHDILSVSDSAIPTIFVSEGIAQCIDGTSSVKEIVDYLREIGYTDIAVIDTDGSLSFDDWKRISSYGRIIPYSERFHSSVFEYLNMPDDLYLITPDP